MTRASLLLFLFIGSAVAAPQDGPPVRERDEKKAGEFLHCAQVSSAVTSLAAKNGDEDAANAFRQMRIHFLLAAAMKADGEFLKSQAPKVNQNITEHRAGDKEYLGKQAESCSKVWNVEIQPLLQRRPSAPTK